MYEGTDFVAGGWALSRLDELRFMTRVAQRYYAEGQRQSSIARDLKLSQATVSRLLKRAVDEGIVRISLSAPPGTYPELEQGIREAFGISEAVVVDVTVDQDDAIMARIGEAAAHFLEATLQEGEVIGVSSWSQTIRKMIDNIHPMKSGRAGHVVQMVGGIGSPNVQKHATQLTTRLAQLTGAAPLILNAPAVVSSPEARLVLLGDTYVRQVMDQFENITLAFVGIGAVEPSKMLADSGNIFSADELQQLADRGAVAEMGQRFLKASGDVVKTALDDRVIGMSMEQLRAVPRVVALAGGQKKTDAIAAAVRSGAIDYLITDKFSAARLCGRSPDGSGSV